MGKFTAMGKLFGKAARLSGGNRGVGIKPGYECRLAFLLAGVLLCGAATSFAQTEAAPNTPGQSIPGTGGVSPFSGSVPAKLVPGVLPLSLAGRHRPRIENKISDCCFPMRTSARPVDSAGKQLSALLPHVTATPYVAGLANQSRRTRLCRFPGTFQLSRHRSALSLILTRAST